MVVISPSHSVAAELHIDYYYNYYFPLSINQ